MIFYFCLDTMNFKLAHKACPSDAEGVSAIASLSALVHNDLGLNSLITCFSFFHSLRSPCPAAIDVMACRRPPCIFICEKWKEVSVICFEAGFWRDACVTGCQVRVRGWLLRLCVCASVYICRGCTLFASGWWRATYAHWSDRGLMFN